MWKRWVYVIPSIFLPLMSILRWRPPAIHPISTASVCYSPVVMPWGTLRLWDIRRHPMASCTSWKGVWDLVSVVGLERRCLPLKACYHNQRVLSEFIFSWVHTYTVTPATVITQLSSVIWNVSRWSLYKPEVPCCGVQDEPPSSLRRGPVDYYSDWWAWSWYVGQCCHKLSEQNLRFMPWA